MSAPDTNIETQKERHAPSLIGIKGAMIFGALMLVVIFGYSMMSDGDAGATAYEGGAATTATD